MKRTLTFLSGLFLVLFSFSQNQLDVTIGAGYTAIDIESLVEEDEISGTVATDWDQFTIGLSAQYFFLNTSSFQFGVEAMYHHLYWYSVRVPFGSQDINREYTVTAFRITPIFRFGKENFAFDVGPELNFNDGTEIGLMLSANQYFPINDKIDIPVKARLDIINGIVITVPITLHAGVRVRI